MLELAYSVLTTLISMAEVQGLAVLSEISRVPHLPPLPLPSPFACQFAIGSQYANSHQMKLNC